MNSRVEPEDGHEQLGREGHLTAALVVDRDLGAREVHEQLLARLVRLTHDDVEVPAPAPVEQGELAVGVAVGEGLFVLVPQKHEGDVGTAQLEVDLLPVGLRARTHRRGGRAEQESLEAVIVEILGQRPAETGRHRPLTVVKGMPSEALTWRRLRPSPNFRRSTSRILRMLIWGRGIGTSSNVLPDCSSQGAVPPSRHASCTRPPAPGCTKTPEWVYGFDRNGCTDSIGMGVRIRSEWVYGNLRNRQLEL
jgi:hypothetical protein